MRCKTTKIKLQRPFPHCARSTDKRAGLTLVEMLTALALVVIIFAAILPQFRIIENTWAAKAGAVEIIQSSRVLADHLNRNLSKAVKITDVSDAAQTIGYIQFEDNDGNNFRYEIASNYVQFGNVGNLSDLAGPVSKLQFTCYDVCDLDTPLDISTEDINDIRFVEIETTLNNATTGPDKTFTAAVYLRTNGNPGLGISTETTYDYSNRTQGTDIFAYDGEHSQQVPSGSTSPSDVLSSGEYDNIELDDTVFHTYDTSALSKYAQMRFVIQIDDNESDVTQIIATFNGKSINSKNSSDDGLSFYIWNYDTSAYELLEESADTEAEVTLTGTLTGYLVDYIGGAGDDTITLLAVSNSKLANNNTLTLSADYVKLEISACIGCEIDP